MTALQARPVRLEERAIQDIGGGARRAVSSSHWRAGPEIVNTQATCRASNSAGCSTAPRAERNGMDADQLERVSEAVHNGWMAEKQAQGFADHAWPNDRHGQNCWRSKDRHHPDMLPYADLAENVREYDRATVRAFLRALDAAGLAVVTIDALRALGTAVGLLNSMVLCGEQHSDTSRAAVRAASSYQILSVEHSTTPTQG